MYLSNRDIKWAIDCGKLIVEPRPEDLNCGYDETAIDLHLGPIATARVWDLQKLKEHDRTRGAGRPEDPPEVRIGSFDWDSFSSGNLIPVPDQSSDEAVERRQLVCRRGHEILVKQFGFLLWTTKETIGTPKVPPDLSSGLNRHPELISFVNAKSTRARTGLMVHFTAPTIHAGWAGKVVLEITNLGPFTFVMKEGDALAQLTVATISSAPDLELIRSRSHTQGQTDPSGRPR